MAYGIVKNHSGGISVESAPGKGTLFRVYLPAVAHRASSAPDAETGPYPKGTETVLLVDDEPALREMGESMLQALGYRTYAVEDGEAACRLFRERKGEIDLVLLDIIMPRMGGREAFRELRRMKPGIPVLLSSGYSMEGVVQEMLAEGANGFLPKPYGLSQVARAIRKVLSAGAVS
jgi:CheY-like chemotaxis protein